MTTAATTTTTRSHLETLPVECFVLICAHVPLTDMASLTRCSKSMATLCGSDNTQLWNLLLCDRLWTVDPSVVLGSVDQQQQQQKQLEDTFTKQANHETDWKDQYRILVQAERSHQQYLDDLKNLDLDGIMDRHFIGQFLGRNGWDARYCKWNSRNNSFTAWDSEAQIRCLGHLPVGSQCKVRRVSKAEQVALTIALHNPITHPKPYVFTITNSTFPMLWACRDKEQLQLWLDKIAVTIHPLQFNGQAYKAPAKYLYLPPKRPCQP